MFVVMRPGATEAEVNGVKGLILAEGLTPFENAGTSRTVIAVVGELGKRREQLRAAPRGALPGVAQVTPISKPVQARLARVPSRGHRHPRHGRVDRRRVADGHGRAVLRGEPRAADGDGRLRRGGTARRSSAAARSSRAPSPYSFQGLGVEGLRYLAEARERTGMPMITEVMEPSQVDIVAEYADILQIGTRNMQNFSLLLAVGRVARPVMLKRGFGATIEEWLMAAEYIVARATPT